MLSLATTVWVGVFCSVLRGDLALIWRAAEQFS